MTRRTGPLVSCLMVTRGRIPLALQAIDCFAGQRYTPRELVIVTDRASDHESLQRAVHDRPPGPVRLVFVDGPDRPLGALRNVAIEAAAGELMAQWDDDDLYHPDRLTAQVRALAPNDVACFFTEQWQFFSSDRSLFVIDWRRRTELQDSQPGWDCIPGTVLFRRDPDIQYPPLPRHEDRMFMERLLSRGSCARLTGQPQLYMYRVHGANTFDEEHFRYITRWAVGRPRLVSDRTAMEIAAAWYAPYLGDAAVRVQTSDGATAFVLRPLPHPRCADRHRALVPAPAPRLRITVAIATWNRATLLGETLAALADVAVPPNLEWEVLVCDNASTDQTQEVLTAARDSLPLRILFEPRSGKSFALLRLLGEARGDWVLFLDDDVIVDVEWLCAYMDGVRRYPNAGCFGGPVKPWLTEPARGLRGWLLREFDWMHAVVEIDDDDEICEERLQHVHGPNFAVRRAAVRLPEDIDTRRGMFGQQRISGEDLALVRNLRARGWEGWRLSRAVVHHFIPRERSGWRWWVARQMGEARSAALDRGLPPNDGLAFRLFALRCVGWQLIRTLLRPVRLRARLAPLSFRSRRAVLALRRRLPGGRYD